jgi:hypothetical protein
MDKAMIIAVAIIIFFLLNIPLEEVSGGGIGLDLDLDSGSACGLSDFTWADAA